MIHDYKDFSVSLPTVDKWKASEHDQVCVTDLRMRLGSVFSDYIHFKQFCSYIVNFGLN